MKLEKLTINNINSFVGNKTIDFTQFGNELFLITGATGAGKTTIFDAICAVLYNQTPRLNRKGKAKNLLNNLRYKGSITLNFSVGNDKFKATWEVRRKKDKSIDDAKRALYKNNTQIARNTTEFQKEFSKILNLEFEQFTKTIILAQGEFNAFLKAKDNEKIAILEKILPIKKYELISSKIYKKKGELENSIKNIDEKIQNLNHNDKTTLTQNIEKQENLKKEIEKLNNELKIVEKNITQFNTKKRLLNENKKLRVEIANLETQNSQLEKDISILETEFHKIKSEKEEFEKSLSHNLNELDKAIEFKQLLLNLKEKIKNKNLEKEKLENEIKELSDTIEKNSQKTATLNKKLKELNIEDNEKFQYISELIPLKIEFDTLKDEQKKLKDKIKENSEKCEKLTKKCEKLENSIKEKSEEVEYLEAKIKVLKYEEDRKLLKDDEPCPLCGSKKHPYKKKAPKVDKKRYETLKEEIEKEKKEFLETQNELNLIKKLNEESEKKLKENKKRQKEIKEFFKNRGIEIKNFDKLKTQKEEFDKKLEEKNSLETEIKILKTKIEENEKVLKEKNSNLENIKKEIEKLEVDYNQNIKIANSLKEKLVKIVGEFDDAKRKKDELLEKNKNLNNLFTQKQQKLNEIKNSLATNSQLKKDKEKKISQNSAELEKIKIEEKDYETLKNELLEKIGNYREEIGIISKTIKEIEENLEKLKILNKEKEKINKQLKLFTKLDKLIGSSKGDKFKKIAINFMMRELIQIANIHLDKLSNGRYLFEIDKNIDRLDLFVIDKFNENEKRGVETLSGGESFLASLALSFGLSDMIKQKIEIETLFLDEGFGSLDDNTLNNALNILKEASGGKMIGIISHVNSLKEEIPRQIQVIKLGNGQSDIKII